MKNSLVYHTKHIYLTLVLDTLVPDALTVERNGGIRSHSFKNIQNDTIYEEQTCTWHATAT